MAFPVWLNNLIAYCLQIAILASAGTLLAHLFRLRLPRVTLRYWQLLLLACILLPCLQRWQHPAISRTVQTEAAGATVTTAVHEVVVQTEAESARRIPWGWIFPLLVAGIVLRLLWLVIGFLRLARFRQKSHLFSEESSIIQDMQWRTGVRVTVLLSSTIHSPVTYGLRSPTIMLPLAFKDLSDACKQAVLFHELLHVRRYDWIVIIVEEVIRSLFWFHPAIWWLLSRVNLSREQAVDYEVVQLTGNRQPYLDSLMEFAQTQSRVNAVPAPLFLREHHLVQRVTLLIKEVSMSRSHLTVSMIGISALLIATLYIASGWLPLMGNPVFAQEKISRPEIQTAPSSVSAPPVQIAALATDPQPAAAAAPTAVQTQDAPHNQPIRVGGSIQESKLIHKVAPIYPDLAKRMRVTGIVRLEVTTNEDGYVREVTAVDGPQLLRESAIEAVKQWQYSPTIVNGTSVPVMATVTVIFSLAGAPPQTQDAPVEILPPQNQPIRVGGTIQERKLIHKVAPIYPDLAKRTRVQGTVQLEVTTNEDGYVWEVKAVDGPQLLRESAIEAVKQWQYSPTIVNGASVPVMAHVAIKFTLMDDNGQPVSGSESSSPANVTVTTSSPR
jgi:TonB family protein